VIQEIWYCTLPSLFYHPDNIMREWRDLPSLSGRVPAPAPPHTEHRHTVPPQSRGPLTSGHYQFYKIGRVQPACCGDGAGTQNCLYGYDDITRITNANCGSAAAQTFSFDAFGKISMVGSPFSFTPTYSAATNRMASINGFTHTTVLLASPTRFTRRFRIMARECRKNDWQRFNPKLSGLARD